METTRRTKAFALAAVDRHYAAIGALGDTNNAWNELFGRESQEAGLVPQEDIEEQNVQLRSATTAYEKLSNVLPTLPQMEDEMRTEAASLDVLSQPEPGELERRALMQQARKETLSFLAHSSSFASPDELGTDEGALRPVSGTGDLRTMQKYMSSNDTAWGTRTVYDRVRKLVDQRVQLRATIKDQKSQITDTIRKLDEANDRMEFMLTHDQVDVEITKALQEKELEKNVVIAELEKRNQLLTNRLARIVQRTSDQAKEDDQDRTKRFQVKLEEKDSDRGSITEDFRKQLTKAKDDYKQEQDTVKHMISEVVSLRERLIDVERSRNQLEMDSAAKPAAMLNSDEELATKTAAMLTLEETVRSLQSEIIRLGSARQKAPDRTTILDEEMGRLCTENDGLHALKQRLALALGDVLLESIGAHSEDLSDREKDEIATSIIFLPRVEKLPYDWSVSPVALRFTISTVDTKPIQDTGGRLQLTRALNLARLGLEKGVLISQISEVMVRDSLACSFEVLPALLEWLQSPMTNETRILCCFLSCRFLELAIRTGRRDHNHPPEYILRAIKNPLKKFKVVPAILRVYMDWLELVLKDPDEQSTPIDVMRKLGLDAIQDIGSRRTLFADDWGVYLLDETEETPTLCRFDLDELTVTISEVLLISFNSARSIGVPREFHAARRTISWMSRHLASSFVYP
jgi:hypothetical protein